MTIFQGWLEKARVDYPGLKASPNENKIYDDLKDAFEEALVSYQMAPKQKKADPQWSIDYITGFVEGNINTCWLIQFIIKDSDQYRRLLLLKSLNNLIYVDSDVQHKLRHLYKNILEEEHNPLVDRESNIISLEDYGVTNNRELDDLVDEIRQTIARVIEKDYMTLLREYKQNYCPPLSDFIDSKLMELLIQ